MNLLYAIEHFEITDIEINARAHCRQHSLPLTGGAMNGETHPHQMFDDMLDLLFSRCVLHRNNHK